MNTSDIKIHHLAIVLVLMLWVSFASAQDKTKAGSNPVVKTGQQIYLENCLSCHQANGSGVMSIAPPLRKTSYVLGSKSILIGIVLNGFNEDVEIEGEYYSNPMPAFPHLSDEEVAKVLTYVRSNFGNNAEPVTVKEVSLERAKMNVKK